jgi:UDP-glucose 4-epimerase
MNDEHVDVVFHLATPARVGPSFPLPADDLRRNVGSTLTVLEAIRKVKPPPLLVYASSAAVYGEAQRLPMGEEHPICPMSPYGVSKFAAEQYLRLYSKLYELRSLSVRLFSLYGPGQRKQVVYELISQASSGDDPLCMRGAPEISRDLVFVRDAARAMVTLAGQAPARGEAYNIASGTRTTLRQLAEAIRTAMDLDIGLSFGCQVHPGEPTHWLGNPAKARRFGVECGTPLMEGLERTIAWFASTHQGALSVRALNA